MAETGRPSKYKPIYCQTLIEYFSVKPYSRKTIEIFDEDTGETRTEETGDLEASDFPSFEGFALSIGVCSDTLREWRDTHEEFSASYKMAKDYQKVWLLINGNKGTIEKTWGIFTAKNCTDMRDQKTVELTGGEKPIQIEPFDLQERIKQLKKESSEDENGTD